MDCHSPAGAGRSPAFWWLGRRSYQLTHAQQGEIAKVAEPERQETVSGQETVRAGNGVRKCAGINRHAVEDERALQERSSEPPGLESCGGSREAAVEA